MEATKDYGYFLVNETLNGISVVYEAVPGAKIVWGYVAKSYQNDPGRTLLEFFLFFFMVWYWYSKRYAPGVTDVELTEKEIDQLIEEWEPEPLCKELTEFQKFELEKVPTYTGTIGLKTKGLDGKDRANFAAFNFLGLLNSDVAKEKAVEALRKYGVGSCGPPGFYGTLDVHMELEEKIAAFIGTEHAILYSQGFSCISSVIPAFCKRGDVILADESVNFAIQKGLQISRSAVKYFKHNDMEDLERLMILVQKDRKKKRLPLTRQFIVVEGIYTNTGLLCPLPQLVELKEKYKYRLMIEESISLGAIGSRGAGVTNHFDISSTKVDMIVASLSNAFGGAGGICAGNKEIVEHQRLGGQSYVYSASLPAILAVTSLQTISHLETTSDNPIARIAQYSDKMAAILEKAFVSLPVYLEGAGGVSPILHIRMKMESDNREEDERFLQEIVDLAARDSVILTRAKYIPSHERKCPSPSIRIAISAGFTSREIERTGTVIKDAVRRVVKSRQQKSFF